MACKKLAPVLGNAEDDYEDKIKIYKVNTNFDVELAEQYEDVYKRQIMWHLSFVSNRFDNMFRIELFRNSFPVTNEKENIGGRVENRP